MLGSLYIRPKLLQNHSLTIHTFESDVLSTGLKL